MTRHLYGATPSDVAFNADTGRLAPGAIVTIWNARTSGTQVTDLQDTSSSPIAEVTADAYGFIAFYGPDDTVATLWAQGGVGDRVALFPIDTANVATATLDTLSNVAANAPLNGQVLSYLDGTWRPVTPSSGGGEETPTAGGFVGVPPAEGEYFNQQTGTDTVELDEDELIAWAVFTNETIDVDAFAIEVTNAVASSSVRVAILDSTCTTRLFELGTVATTSVGVKELTPTTPGSITGLFYIAAVAQGADGVQLKATEGWALPSSTAAFGKQVNIHDGAVSGSIPDTFVLDTQAAGPVPAVALRRAAA